MNEKEQMKMYCQQYMNQPVLLHVNGQPAYSGIIENVDEEYVYLMVPVNENGEVLDLGQFMNQTDESQMMMRQYPYGYPYPYYPYYPYYGPRPYGWNRIILPLAALTALSVLF